MFDQLIKGSSLELFLKLDFFQRAGGDKLLAIPFATFF
jgi:hypothetical protein